MEDIKNIIIELFSTYDLAEDDLEEYSKKIGILPNEFSNNYELTENKKSFTLDTINQHFSELLLNKTLNESDIMFHLVSIWKLCKDIGVLL